MTNPPASAEADEERFRQVFEHLGAVTAYARRRGSPDAEAIAAEVMTVAWRRLATVPLDDPRPWLFATARNLTLAEWRSRRPDAPGQVVAATAGPLPAEGIDPELIAALRVLSAADREVLLLVAWEDLSPKLAARSLGISEGAFRVRLHRARRRFGKAMTAREASPTQSMSEPIGADRR